MYKRTDKYCLDGTKIRELINGNWVVIANFYWQTDGRITPETMASMMFISLTK